MARRRLGSRRGGGFRLTVGAVVAVVLVLGALVLLRSQSDGDSAQRLETTGDDAVAAGGRVGGGVFDGIDDFRERIVSAWNAADRIAALKKENNELKEWKELALALSERTERYEALLKMPHEALGQGTDVDSAISARLILDSGGPFKRTLLANAGADHGVKTGYVAINENGLIGRVVAVGRRSSRILLLDDYNSRVPVMGESSRARALLVGRAGQAPRLDTGPLQLVDPQLQFVVGAGGLRAGERIVTSGDGGVYPRGLLVGWAAAAPGGNWVARLGASRAPIDFVRLIPYIDPEAPEAAPVKDAGLPPPPAALITAAPKPAPVVPKPVIVAPPIAPATPATAAAEEAPTPPPTTTAEAPPPQ